MTKTSCDDTIGDEKMSSDWHPIKTAPKDGTRLILWVPGHDIAVSGSWQFFTGEYEGPHCFYPGFYDWAFDNDVYINDDEKDKPTYWKFLDPPKGT